MSDNSVCHRLLILFCFESLLTRSWIGVSHLCWFFQQLRSWELNGVEANKELFTMLIKQFSENRNWIIININRPIVSKFVNIVVNKREQTHDMRSTRVPHGPADLGFNCVWKKIMRSTLKEYTVMHTLMHTYREHTKHAQRGVVEYVGLYIYIYRSTCTY